MKLFRYKNFIKESKEDIDSICEKYGIGNYIINEDGSIDVDENVYSNKKIPIKFRNVSGDFHLSDKNIKSSIGCCPISVGGDFVIDGGDLDSLIGCPRSVRGDFVCWNNKLTSLVGISEEIRGNIYCQNNSLRDVQGIKDGWGGRLTIFGNPVFEILKLFPINSFDEAAELLNEHDVIRDGKLIILQRLEQVFYDMGLEVPEIENIEGYNIQY
jgi:hypothetical protein